MKLKYYLIEGMTRIVGTFANRDSFTTEDNWLAQLQQSYDYRLSVHVDLETQLTEKGFKDGDEVPADMFTPSAVPKSMEDQFTQS